jgi:hypothetical protein
MVAESCQVAFTVRQWEAYQFVLEFHRRHDRAPTAAELGRGLRVPLADSIKLIGALTAKGVLERRVYHVLAVVPPSYQRPEFAEAFGNAGQNSAGRNGASRVAQVASAQRV